MIKKITKITTYDKSNEKINNKQLPKQQQQKEKKIFTIYPKIFVLKTYQSYKNTDAQHDKTARHFLQY